ncbi:MAG TPA: hypothetical protein PKE45_08625 [Caldilineaceae bacterium]|nr:hypothetical protein [Caldilineaceae bacterium]
MDIWLTADLSPKIAPWIRQTFAFEAQAVRAVGLATARAVDVYIAACASADVILTRTESMASYAASAHYKSFADPPELDFNYVLDQEYIAPKRYYGFRPSDERPPKAKVILLRSGNLTNAALRQILSVYLLPSLAALKTGEAVVKINSSHDTIRLTSITNKLLRS